jgi:hypothetical protein
MLSDAVPGLVRVTGSGWLVVPTTSTPKLKVIVDKVAFGNPPRNHSAGMPRKV